MKKLTEKEKTINYLEKTSKHLFQRNRLIDFTHLEHMFKAFNLKIGKENYIGTVEFNEEIINVKIKKISNHENSFNNLKSSLFPSYESGKSKSIKHFKKIRRINHYIKKTKYDSVDEAKLIIKKIFEDNY